MKTEIDTRTAAIMTTAAGTIGTTTKISTKTESSVIGASILAKRIRATKKATDFLPSLIGEITDAGCEMKINKKTFAEMLTAQLLTGN